MCKKRGCDSDNYRPALEPLHEKWIWCLDCHEHTEFELYQETEAATAPSRKTKKQGDQKKEEKKKEEPENEKLKQVNAKAANRKIRKKVQNNKKKNEPEPEVLSCKIRGCTFETTSSRGLSSHTTKMHHKECDVEGCEFDTTSDQGMSIHRTRMHPDAPPCSEHPRYTAKRKPRSGCETCMKAYEKNQ